MGLKSIEMQVALPRTHELGKLQEQLQQRGQLQNDFSSLSVKKEELKKQTTVVKEERKDIARFKDDGNRNKELYEKKSKKKKEKKKEVRHPYKGQLLDYSG